jgi:hypothetical protein
VRHSASSVERALVCLVVSAPEGPSRSEARRRTRGIRSATGVGYLSHQMIPGAESSARSETSRSRRPDFAPGLRAGFTERGEPPGRRAPIGCAIVANDRIHLKEGVDPASVIARLRSLKVTARAALNRSPLSEGFWAMLNEFVQRVESGETALRSFTLDPDPITAFHTARSWHIRALTPDSPRPWPLLEAEVELQSARLETIADHLEERVSLCSAQLPGGALAVLGTNVLLHYQPPAQIPWRRLLKVSLAQLVLPLRVVEELDAKKTRGRGELTPSGTAPQKRTRST